MEVNVWLGLAVSRARASARHFGLVRMMGLELCALGRSARAMRVVRADAAHISYGQFVRPRDAQSRAHGALFCGQPVQNLCLAWAQYIEVATIETQATFLARNMVKAAAVIFLSTGKISNKMTLQNALSSLDAPGSGH